MIVLFMRTDKADYRLAYFAGIYAFFRSGLLSFGQMDFRWIRGSPLMAGEGRPGEYFSDENIVGMRLVDVASWSLDYISPKDGVCSVTPFSGIAISRIINGK